MNSVLLPALKLLPFESTVALTTKLDTVEVRVIPAEGARVTHRRSIQQSRFCVDVLADTIADISKEFK